ncbi:MAG: cation diffusion facilitator family transporter [Acholeplasmataceae bacterium]
MKQQYQIYGFHCHECALKFQTALSKQTNLGPIDFDPHTLKVGITDKKDYDVIHLLAQAHGGHLVEPPAALERAKKENHHHHHHHAHDHSSRNIGIAFLLNLLFSISEFVFGAIFNSIAIMSDAVHDLGDAFSIGIAWILQRMSKKEPDEKYKDGYGRFSVLGALFTGLFLIGGSIFMIARSIPRLINPQAVNYDGMLIFAVIAIFINVFAWYLMNRGHSKNEKMLSYHMLEDVLGWVAVLAVSIILRFTDWYILDPILGILIASFILYKASPEFLDSLKVFLNRVPVDVDLIELEKAILQVEGVHKITNIHTHSLDGEENMFAATLFVGTNKIEEINAIKNQVRTLLIQYEMTQSTLEVVVDINQIA